MTWSRDTLWSQGGVLSQPSLGALHPAAAAAPLAIAISHSCDIANDSAKEPQVEFVLGKWVSRTDGNLTRAKNPRLLHLNATMNGQAKVVELSARDKFSISKEQLASHLPDAMTNLQPEELPILQAWLAARYKRQALPGALQHRLRPIVDALEKQGKQHADGVLGYWLDYQPREELTAKKNATSFGLRCICQRCPRC